MNAVYPITALYLGPFVIFGLGLAIAGTVLWAEYIGDDILALALVANAWLVRRGIKYPCDRSR